MSKGFFDPEGTSPYAFAVAIFRDPVARVALAISVVCLVIALTR